MPDFKPVVATEKPTYEKWVALIGASVAVLSLLINVYQAFSTASLDKKNKELEVLLKDKDIRADIESRYLVIGALTAIEFLQGNAEKPIAQNIVWQQLQPWIDGWQTGEHLVETNSGIRAHGIVFLRVANRGKQDAQQLVLTVKQKSFSKNGQGDENLWELDTKAWKVIIVRLADLPAGKSILVPLAHVAGTKMYYGSVLVPVQLEWYNFALQKKEPPILVQGMAPEDQWISNGLNVSIAQ